MTIISPYEQPLLLVRVMDVVAIVGVTGALIVGVVKRRACAVVSTLAKFSGATAWFVVCVNLGVCLWIASRVLRELAVSAQGPANHAYAQIWFSSLCGHLVFVPGFVLFVAAAQMILDRFRANGK